MVKKVAMTAEDSFAILERCKRTAIELGAQVTIAIVDDGGHLWRLERLDGAGPLSIETAVKKAKCSALSRRPTSFWDGRVKESLSTLAIESILPLPGGIPLTLDGTCLGAVGVAGAMPADDEKIALSASTILSALKPG